MTEKEWLALTGVADALFQLLNLQINRLRAEGAAEVARQLCIAMDAANGALNAAYDSRNGG